MKSVIVLALLALVAGCGQTQMTAWGLAESNLDNPANEYTGRVCLLGVSGEAGLEVNYSGVRDRPDSFGIFTAYHFGGDPSSVIGQPYAAYRLGTDGDGGGYYGPCVGTIYRDIFVVEGRLAQEYSGALATIHNATSDENQVRAGLRFKF